MSRSFLASLFCSVVRLSLHTASINWSPPVIFDIWSCGCPWLGHVIRAVACSPVKPSWGQDPLPRAGGKVPWLQVGAHQAARPGQRSS